MNTLGLRMLQGGSVGQGSLLAKGSLVAIVTPMLEDGSLDIPSLKALIEFHIDQGTDGIVIVGTTGESPTVDFDEHCLLIKTAVNQVNGRVPVIAGTGANSTKEAIELTQKAKELGVDACLLVAPYYNKPTQEGLYLHYKAIAESVDIPQILYNVPGRTACDMLPSTVGRLSSIPNIIGVKEATGDLSRVHEIRSLVGNNFAIYTGDDATSLEFCLLGGNGTITVTGNVAPRLVHEMITAAMTGDKETALLIDAKLMDLHKYLFIQSNPIPVKWAVAEMGLIPNGIRLPLTWLTEDCFNLLRDAMRKAEVL